MVFGFVKAELEPTGQYRFIDSVTRLGITHVASGTKLRVISSNGKTAMGLVNVPLAVCDEPGSWNIAGGLLMWDALTGAQGKPGSPLKIVIIGTLAPFGTNSGHWWWDLVHDGSVGSTYVMALQGNAATWSSWSTIRKANPLTAISPEFRKKLLEERDAARMDSRLRSRYLSYRLNWPARDESQMLLSVDDWKAVERRPVPEAEGKPIVGCDLGGGAHGRQLAPFTVTDWWTRWRWHPASRRLTSRKNVTVCLMAVINGWWTLACCGLPMVCEYRHRASYGKQYAPSGDGQITSRLTAFALTELQDAVKNGARIEPRVTRWSEAAFDIRALRKAAKDGPLSVVPEARALLRASLEVAQVKSDDQGNTRMEKKGTNNTARDDVAAALDRWALVRWHGNQSKRRGCILAWHSTDKDKIDRRRWARLRQEVLTRDGWRCQHPQGAGICGRRGRLECDHKLAMRFGGAVYALENLWILCREHHMQKSAIENATEPESAKNVPNGANLYTASY